MYAIMNKRAGVTTTLAEIWVRSREPYWLGAHTSFELVGGDVMYPFVTHPGAVDYHTLADLLETVPSTALHSALWPRRRHVAASLRRMAAAPEQERYVSAYQALRLFVWQ